LVVRHGIADLPDPLAPGQGPERGELRRGDLGLHLSPVLTVPLLDGQEVPLPFLADPDLGPALGDGEIPLADLGAGVVVEPLGGLVEEELALDLSVGVRHRCPFRSLTLVTAGLRTRARRSLYRSRSRWPDPSCPSRLVGP